MNGSGTTRNRSGIPQRVHRLIVVGIVAYFLLYGAFVVTNHPYAFFVAELVFGVIAVGLGATLFGIADGEWGAELAAAALLVVGGIAQFSFLLTFEPLLSTVSSVAVFAGVGLYVYTVWVSE